MDARFFATFWLGMPEILHALRLSDHPDSATFVVERGGAAPLAAGPARADSADAVR